MPQPTFTRLAAAAAGLHSPRSESGRGQVSLVLSWRGQTSPRWGVDQFQVRVTGLERALGQASSALDAVGPRPGSTRLAWDVAWLHLLCQVARAQPQPAPGCGLVLLPSSCFIRFAEARLHSACRLALLQGFARLAARRDSSCTASLALPGPMLRPGFTYLHGPLPGPWQRPVLPGHQSALTGLRRSAVETGLQTAPSGSGRSSLASPGPLPGSTCLARPGAIVE